MTDVKSLFPNARVHVTLAAAGAGKTRDQINTFNDIIKTTDPSRVALVTFTRKGVETIMDRIMMDHPELDRDDLSFVRTLHSLCFHQLGLDFKSLWSPKYEAIMNSALGTSVHRRYSPEHATRDNMLLDQYDLVRNGGKADEDVITSGAYKRITAAYEEVKQKTGAVDFTDCLTRFIAAGEAAPVDQALIDEAQDLTELQWQVCSVAFRNCTDIYIAGDDYQTIFQYAGANPEVLIDLANTYGCRKLEVSHRIPHKVYRLAKAITNMLKVKVDKDYAPDTSREGEVRFLPDVMSLYPFLTEDTGKSWYILTRNTSFQDSVEVVLRSLVIPYHRNHVFFIPDADMKKIHKYYSFRKTGYGSPEALKEFLESMGIPSVQEDLVDSGMFPPQTAALYQLYIDKYGEDMLYELYKGKEIFTLSNIHRVKGGEADNVAVLLDCGRKVGESIAEDTDAELHTLYVAVTRAKEKLFLVHSSRNTALDELLEKCLVNARLESEAV